MTLFIKKRIKFYKLIFSQQIILLMNVERINELKRFVEEFNGQLEDSYKRYDNVKQINITPKIIKQANNIN